MVAFEFKTGRRPSPNRVLLDILPPPQEGETEQIVPLIIIS